MPNSNHSRDMSMLVGTSKTLERAVAGMLMNATRFEKVLAEESGAHPESAGLSALLAAMSSLSADDRVVVDHILSGRDKLKRKAK